MKTINIKNISFFALMGLACLSNISCSEEIEIPKDLSETGLPDLNTISGYMLDANSGKADNTIELRADSYTTSIVFGLNRIAGKGVDITMEYDSNFDIDAYNTKHGTNFILYPESAIEIENNGQLILAPDEKLSYELDLTINYSDGLENDRTYILPIKAISVTDGITVNNTASRVTYLVRNYHYQSDAFKGEDAVKSFLFFEVNDVNPLNALEFQLENGKLMFDYVVLFAANINYDAQKKRVYVQNNPNVQFLLDNHEDYIQPLRKRGIKVLLGLLGNHDESGLAQLSETGAKDFAREVAAIIKTYNLDGVNLDNEWSKAPDLDNPLLTETSSGAAARLTFELKEAMPDKDITVFHFNGMYGTDVVDGISAKHWIDIVVGNYGNAVEPIGGLTRKNCSGMSYELNLGKGYGLEEYARQVKEQGYGYYMFFALYSGGQTQWDKQIQTCQNVAKGLYDIGLLRPTHYYLKNSVDRMPM